MPTRPIHFLRLRKEDGLWVFDDPDKDLAAEPFLADATALLDKMVAADANDSPTPLLMWSLDQYATFTLLEFIHEENGGVVYRCAERFDGSAWLCPQFWKYFDRAPETIYVRLIDSPLEVGNS